LVPPTGCHLPIGAETDPRQKSVHRVWSVTPALALADTCTCARTVVLVIWNAFVILIFFALS